MVGKHVSSSSEAEGMRWPKLPLQNRQRFQTNKEGFWQADQKDLFQNRCTAVPITDQSDRTNFSKKGRGRCAASNTCDLNPGL